MTTNAAAMLPEYAWPILADTPVAVMDDAADTLADYRRMCALDPATEASPAVMHASEQWAYWRRMLAVWLAAPSFGPATPGAALAREAVA